MNRFDQQVTAQQLRRATDTVGGAIRDGGPKGQGSALHTRCDAVAGFSSRLRMT
jgi:hypothetical protein